MPDRRNVTLENVQITFRNFAGAEKEYNPEGRRNFSVLLDPLQAVEFEANGWNVKYMRPRENEEQGQAHLQVTVNFKGRPPQLHLITSRGQTPIGEKDVQILDWVQVESCDLTISPYDWKVSGKTGRKAYLDELYLTAYESPLYQKHKHIPLLGSPKRLELESPGAAEERERLALEESGIWDGEVISEEEEEEAPF